MGHIRTSIILTIFLLITINSWAFLVPTETIGRSYNDGWEYPATSSYVGLSNRGGTSIGFRISQPSRISIVKGILRGSGEWGLGSIGMSLIRGSLPYRDTKFLVPTQDVIFTTQRFNFQLNNEQHVVSHNANLNLEAGDYWVKFQGAAMSGHVIAQGFELHEEDFSIVHAPEPATLLLMGGGLLGALRLRRKNKIG